MHGMISHLASSGLLLFTSPLLVFSNAIEQCEVASGCGQQGSSLLQSTDSRSHRMMIDLQGTVQQSLVSADDFVAQLAQRVIGHNVPLTVEENTALKTIEDFISRLLLEAVSQHAADQQTVNGAKDLMVTCNTNANASLHGEVDGYLKDMEDARDAHSDCRKLQVIDNGTMDTDCQNYTQYRRLDMAAEPPQCMKGKHLAVGYVQTSNEEHQKLMESCLEKTKPWLDPLYSRYKLCQHGIDNVTGLKAKCDPKQTKFERNYCEFVDKHDDACSALETCLSNGRTNRDSIHATIKVDEGARMGDWSAAKHISCLFGVFKAENKDKNSTFTTCRANIYDTSALKIEYPDEPTPLPCAKKTSKPCDGTWVSSEYTSQTWHDKAPSVECNPCVTPPAPLTPMEVPTGFECIADGSLCHAAGSAASTMNDAIVECSALEARVCTHTDMMELCSHGLNPHEGHTHGWYGDHTTADNWDDEYAIWNRDHCVWNNDGAGRHGHEESLPFRCCKSGVLPQGATASCPSDLAAMNTQNGEICLSDLRSVKSAHEAIADCGTLKGHVCLHNEMQQLCASGNPYEGAGTGWYGDKGVTHYGAYDDAYGTWNADHCQGNNDGYALQDGHFAHRCCAAAGAVNWAGAVSPKKCNDGFAKFGGLCYKDPGMTGNMQVAIETCQSHKSHVCTHVDMQTICSHSSNPYKGEVAGWYGDLGGRDATTNDDWYATWNRGECNANNDGPAAHSHGVSQAFRCCARAHLI